MAGQKHVMPTFARASPQPILPHMSQPSADSPAFHAALKQDTAQFEDCTPCRVVGMPPLCPLLAARPALTLPSGSATFVGLGIFTYASGHSQIRANAAAIRASKSIFGVRSRGMAITGTSAMMLGLGVYRWFA